MAGNSNSAPTSLSRLATRFRALVVAPRQNKESGATARDMVRLTVAAASGQTANIVEVKSSADALLMGIDPSGNILDANGLARFVGNPTSKTIVDGSATSLFDVACASGARCGGAILATVEVGDGTDHQAMTALVTYAAVNKAATLTLTITDLSTVDAKAVSSGTLTLAWTFVTGTGKGTVKLQPTGSLTETTYRVTYTVLPLVGAVTIL